MTKPKNPLDELIPPSGVRAAPDPPPAGTWFRLNVRDLIAEVAARVRDESTATAAPDADDEPAPDTQRSPKVE